MDVGRPNTTTEMQALTFLVQYYSNMLLRRMHVLAPLTELLSKARGIKILLKNSLEGIFKDPNQKIYEETLLNYTGCNIAYKVHFDDSGKQLGSVFRFFQKTALFL